MTRDNYRFISMSFIDVERVVAQLGRLDAPKLSEIPQRDELPESFTELGLG